MLGTDTRRVVPPGALGGVLALAASVIVSFRPDLRARAPGCRMLAARALRRVQNQHLHLMRMD